jgi:pimeloyl-ACP methyl ester carboxylesterase/tetratricopeptide (TPR) repeat protein
LSLAFEVRVLGDFTVRRDGEPVILPQSRKTRALLAYLAVIQKPQRRERLCEIFWDVPDDPRGALRWSLSKLRQILNADGETRLVADRNAVHLKPESIWLDYDLIRGLSADAVGSLPSERLEEIAAAFTGPFLSDLHMPRCQAFESWRVYCSNESEILRLKALRILVDRLGDDPERALGHLHTLQSLLPDDDLGAESARINERARLTVAGHAITADETAEPIVPSFAESLVAKPAPDLIMHSAQATSSRQQIRYVHARDGTRIAYAISGSGPAIVRASHWMSHLEFDWESPVWGHWIEALSSGFTLVRYDGRLNGLSDTRCQDISFDTFVDDLECVVEAAALDRFVLLGISQGCALSVEYAVRHPEKVAGLLVWGGFVRGWRARGNAAEIARREAIAALMRQGWGQDDPLFRQMFTNLFIPGANRVQMDWFNELQRRTLTPENALRLSFAFADVDISRTLEQLQVPALVLHGSGDRVAPISEGRQIARAITRSRFVELDSANHILLADEPAFRNFIIEATTFANEALQPRTAVAADARTRRQATILCANFGYSEQMFQNLPPDVALERVDPFLMQATALVHENGGTILNISENELVASFGAPEPLEGHAALACRAALALRELAHGPAEWMPKIRAGLDTGMVIVAPARNGASEVRGGPVSVAHTLSQALRPDAVVTTAKTRASAGGFVNMQPLAKALLPQYSEEQQLFEVTEIRRGRSRWQLRFDTQLSPFVGREIQLQILNKAWHDASDGEGQTVFVIGDPGVGKSRVTHEFVGAIPAGEAENLEVGALETDLHSGFVVVRKVLQALFGVGDTEAPAIAIEKVLTARNSQGFDERLLEPIMAIMDLPVQGTGWAAISGPERSRRMQEAAVGLLLFLGRRKPFVLLVEDLHWIDAESEAVLVRLAQAVSSARFLLILTSRPEYDRSVFAAAAPAEIRLPTLNAAEAASFLDHLVGRAPELERLRSAVSDACRGNALFMEETVRALAETGKLEGRPGRYRPSGNIDEMVVSANIQTIVDARFERLDKDAKRVAEVASIFGGEIPVPLLQRMAALSSLRFDAALQSLKKADLLVDLQVFPDASVRFKHALIRSAVSGRIVSSSLIELHKAALAELEAYYADRLEEHSERLARHAQQAHLWDGAIKYLLISARKAIKRSAHTTALEQLDLGVSLLRSKEVAAANDKEIDLQLARGVALMAARGWGSTEVLAAFERAEELCGTIDDQERLFTALRGRAQYYMLSGKPAAAQELACRWAGIVKDDSDPGLAIETEHMFWTNNFFLGEMLAANAHAERAIALYEPDRDHYLTYKYAGHDPGVCCRCFAGLSAWLVGEPDRARLRCEDAIGLARRQQHPLSLALAHWAGSYLHILADEPEAALLAAESELKVAEDFQLPLLIGQAAFQIGWSQFRLGERETGVRAMDDALSAIRRTGAEMGLSFLIALYAEALGDSGKLDSARKSIEAALDLGRSNGTYFQLPEIMRIEAGIFEKSGGGSDEVEQMLHKAAAVATLQRSAVGQLRIAIDLARHLRMRGSLENAHELIASHKELIAKLGDNEDARTAKEFL